MSRPTVWLLGLVVVLGLAAVAGADPARAPDEPAQKAINLRAAMLRFQGRYEEAEAILREPLEASRQAGAEHLETARGYGILGLVLQEQGKLAEAEPMFLRAVILLREQRGPEAEWATTYHNWGVNLVAQGRPVEAEPLLRWAVKVDRRRLGPGFPMTIQAANSLALCLGAQGRFAEAEALLTATSKDLAREPAGAGEEGPAIGVPRLPQGLFDKAALKTMLRDSQATLLFYQQKYDQARQGLEESFRESQLQFGEDDRRTALQGYNLAGAWLAQGEPARAEPLFRSALGVLQKSLGDAHPFTALCESNLAATCYLRGRLDEAEQHWEQAARRYWLARLRLGASGLDRVTFTDDQSPLTSLAVLLARRDRPKEAFDRLEQNLSPGLLDELSARKLRPLTAQQRAREADLLRKLQQLDTAAAIVAATEAGGNPPGAKEVQQERDAALAEFLQFQQDMINLHGPAAGQAYDLARIQSRLPDDAALVAWIDLTFFPKAVADVKQRWAGIGRKLGGGEHWACVVRSKGPPRWVRLDGSGKGGDWTEPDDALLDDVLAALRRRPEDLQAAARVQVLTDRLADQRMKPVLPLLSAGDGLPTVTHLVCLPSPALAGIPLETLTDRYTVSYAPSGTMFAWLREETERVRREQADRPASLLALGDPAQHPPGPAGGVPHPRSGVVVAAVLPGSNALDTGLQAGDVIVQAGDAPLAGVADLARALGDGAEGKQEVVLRVWRNGTVREVRAPAGPLGAITRELLPPLPHARREVEAVATLFRPEETKVLVGSQASEEAVSGLAAADRLRDWRFLHFAAHATLDETRPLQSALVLAQDSLPDPLAQVLAGGEVHDGTVRALQVLRTWRLDADLVTLSACQSGLGRPGVEGFLGFSQGLFLAGARSLVLSLWRVDDEAAALLMDRFYENLLGARQGQPPLTRAQALAEAKAWLRDLTRAEVEDIVAAREGRLRSSGKAETPPGGGKDRPFDHPYYWAPFVLIGDPGPVSTAGLPAGGRSGAAAGPAAGGRGGGPVLAVVGLVLIVGILGLWWRWGRPWMAGRSLRAAGRGT